MTELFLVRHGETDWNRARRIQGRTDIPLNDTGREQARATGRLLARRAWDGVVTSPLSRAAETAAIIAHELGAEPPAVLDAVIERDYGDAEGMDFTQLDAMFPRGQAPGRETREQVAARVVPALLALAVERPGTSLVVVSHGGAIRSALEHVQPGVHQGRVQNGSVHSFRVVDGTLELIAFDDPIETQSAGRGGDLDDQNAVERREEAP